MAEVLRDDLWQRLQEIAARQNRSVNDLVESLLGEIEATTPQGSLARLAAAGREMPVMMEPDDVSERADQILRGEYIKCDR